LSAVLESLEFDRTARKASSGKYWSKRHRTDHRVYIGAPPKSKWTGERGGFSTDTLTPLDEVYAPKISSLPYVIQGLLRGEFWDRVGAASWPEKNAAAAWLAKGVEDFANERLDVAYDFEEVEARARRAAEICEHIPTYEGIYAYTKSQGIDLPAIKGRVTRLGCVGRARAYKWWRRKLSRRYRRSAEEKLRSSGFIRRRRGLYCSSFALSARRQQAQATDTYLKERVIRSTDGEQLNLFDVWKGSVANPAIRRAELMTRMRGFEEISKELGHCAEFITLTCPSEYHPYLAITGDPNPMYKGHTVREAQAWLNKMWARARAKLRKAHVLIYGFRIAEAHHDGTPHWHMVLFFAPRDRDTLCGVLEGYWLSEGASDPGASDHRIRFEPIDPKKGSATGYISKYIAKNIDGFEVGADYEAQGVSAEAISAGDSQSGTVGDAEGAALSKAENPSDASNTSQRVGTWSALHGVRQFQQIGGPQVTIYRECRRIREPCHVVSIERARVHADAGSWAGFIKGIGGIAAGRKGSLSLWKEETGECNQYGESRGPQIIGIMGAGLYGIQTHTKKWRIEHLGGTRKPTDLWGQMRVARSADPANWITGFFRLLRSEESLNLAGMSSAVASVAPRIVSDSRYWREGSRWVAGETVFDKLPAWRDTKSHSRSDARSSSASPLGPVSITVAGGPGLSDPKGWTNPNETSMYGPN
jgi:Bacteriophage replication gene A protein (GPA)